MTNRLRKLLRTFSCCVGLLVLLACFSRLNAQSSFFNFNDNAIPDSIAVGANCTLSLQGNIPNPIVTSTIGATIITSMFDQTQSGFPYNGTFIAGETAHVYWFVQDNMGHSYTFEFFVRFVDHTPPTFDLTGVNDTLWYNSIVQVPAAPVIPITDNCGPFTQTYTETPGPDTCAAGQIIRTWKATDQYGNKSTFTQVVVISADVSSPTISAFPQNGSAPCTQLATAYPAWVATQMTFFNANDPSGIRSLTNNAPASFPPGCKVPLSVIFKATDNCGFTMSSTAIFSTSDNQGPVVIKAAKDTIAYCSPGGNHLAKLNEWINKHAYMQVYDSCSAPLTYRMVRNGSTVDSAAVVAAFMASFANPCITQQIGSQMVNKVSALVTIDSFFVSDACGNRTFVGKATFAAVDTLPPVITGGNNAVEECGGGNDQSALQTWINAKAGATISDDCSTAAWSNFSFTTSDGQSGNGSFNSGPYPNVQSNNCEWFTDVTFRASDECGNSSSKVLRFEIDDSQVPVFTGLAPNITVYCPDSLPTVPAATITDNCDLNPAITFTRVYQADTCAGSYTVVTTWKATDACGNTATALQNIFVRDTTPPVFTLVPQNLTMRCDTFVLPPVPVQGQNINATDICSPVTSINTATISFQNPNPALCNHYSYTITRVFTAMDQCGNTSTATQLISVIDNQPPQPTGVLDTTILCSALQVPPVPPPGGMDICSGPTAAPTYVNTQTEPSPDCAGRYKLTLNWIAKDYCGNTTAFSQVVHVIDSVGPTLSNIPPDITVGCDDIPFPPEVSTFNGTDNCSLPVIVSMVETEIRNPDPASCDHWTNYIVRRQWTAKDDCGNTRVYTQNIQVKDSTPPQIISPASINLNSDIGSCGTAVMIPAPLSVIDLCTAGETTVLLRDTLPILPLPSPTNDNTPVDTMFFHFATPNLPPGQPATSDVSLTIYIDSADAEDTSEYFRIYGENGVFLDTTSRTPGQCVTTPGVSNITITAAQFNQWANDGDLAITLVTNGSGGFAINPLNCVNAGRVRMHLGYTYSNPQVPVAVTYSLDGGPSLVYPPPATSYLEAGTHTVIYTATDCAGNSSSTSVQIQVNDTQPPTVLAPEPISGYVGAGNCISTVTLPFPAIIENCRMSGHINRSSAFVPIAFVSNPNAGLVPTPATMDILTGLLPNAIANGKLRIKFKGDNANTREFFNIFHSATLLDTTIRGTLTGQCVDTVVTTITLTAAQINAWTASGSVSFRAEANTNSGPSGSFDFINPCNLPLKADKTDGISIIQAMLEYDYAIVNYVITNNVGNVTVASGQLNGSQTTVSLPPGHYTVKYSSTDNAGLMGMTTFAIIIRDTIKPLAKCKPSQIISVNPSGVNHYILQPSEINDGSIDNCSGTNLSYSLSQDTFRCTQAGNNYTVTLTVKDTSGNTATCSTLVSVQVAIPMPYHYPVCEGDTLLLFANPPQPGLFTYLWMGPGFTSTEQNPIRLAALPSYQGVYSVQITGAGCTSTGSVTVNFASLNVPDINVSGGTGTNFCQGQSVTLGTTTVQGPPQDISYMWYSALPTPTLLFTTDLPTYTINNPPPGQYQYFVKVKIRECLTPNSSVVNVNVFARPPATVTNNSITICAGEQLTLGTNVTGPGLTYQWSGPLGWMASAQFPEVTNSAATTRSGTYTLKTVQNGCVSEPPATVEVTVKYTPPPPQITGPANVCTGNRVVLHATVNGATSPDYYEWQETTTGISIGGTPDTVVIDSATSDHCANWRVRARYQGCFSPWSAAFKFCPEDYPIITASSNSPICEGSVLELTATSSVSIPQNNWSWTYLPGGMQIPFVQNPSIPNGPAGTYQLIAKTAQGCADTASVEVKKSVAPVIDSIDNNTPFCADGITAACLVPFITSQGMSVSYTWTQNGMFVSSKKDLCFSPANPLTNGHYTLVVKNEDGCPSNPWTETIAVQAMVPTPALTAFPDQAVCAGSNVILSLSNAQLFSDTSKYLWFNPQGVLTGNAKELNLLSVLTSQSGNYTMYVTQGVCKSAIASINLTVNPIPLAPIPISNQPVCVGATLQLDVFNPITTGATYHWTALGFSSSLRSPQRPNISLSDEGNYTVSVSVNNCTSPPSTIFVDVIELPKTPVIDPTSLNPVCLEPLPLTGGLRITLSSQTPNAIYTWIDGASKDTIATKPPDTLHYSELPGSLLTPGLHSFQVSAYKDGCSSLLSVLAEVRFDTIPESYAQTDPDGPACVSKAIILRATPPAGNITGQWSLISGPSNIQIANPTLPTTSFNNGAEGTTYSFTWSLSSGGCKNFSIDTLTINVEAPEKAHAGDDVFLCDASNFSLNATQGELSNGTWSQLGQNTVIADPSEPASPVSGFDPGNQYYFVWTLADIGCGASSDTVRVSYYSVKPNITGALFVCTGQNCTKLDVQSIQPWETGQWSSKSGNLQFDQPNNSSTNVCGLVPDVNEIYWTINGSACGNNSRDTIIVNYEIFPVANPDFFETDFGDTVHFNVLLNDILPTTPPSVSIIIQPSNGTVTELANGKYVYKPNSGFSGTDQLVYKICNIRCGPDACSTTTVTFRVGQAGECYIPTIITPNGDGRNDAFKLPPECYIFGEGEQKNIEVTIFNQWGDFVYHRKPFLQDVDAWDGRKDGEDLPAGTYYYVVKFEGADKPKSGFILLQR